MKNKYLLKILVAWLAICLLLPQMARAYTFTETINGVTITFYAESGNSSTCVVGTGLDPAIEKSTSGSISIKSSVYDSWMRKYFTVRGIGNRAFYGCSSLTSITIPSTVTNIGDDAFQDCSSLTSITIPSSVTSIGTEVFTGCTNLESISVESGNTVYDSRSRCNAIIETATNTLIAGCKKTSILNSVTSIGSRAFSRHEGLTSITIPNSVTSIKDRAFNRCSGLTSLTIPNSVICIEDYAFNRCSGLTSLIIPNSVTSIGENPFSDCSGLTSIVVDPNNPNYDSRNNCNAIIETATNILITGCAQTTIPNSVTSISFNAFCGCSGLKEVTIPNSVTCIDKWAFFECSALTSILIPNSVTSIGYLAFYGCSSLKEVTIPNSVTSIDGGAFLGCSSLVSVISLIETPFDIPVNVFSTKLNPTLYVPIGTKSLYETTAGWNVFRDHIEEVAPAEPVIVIANSYTRKYGESNPKFGFTSSGGTLEGTPDITCEATATSPVGTYPIIISRGSVTNTDATFANGTLTVTKTPLVISSGTYEMTQGEALPTFTAIYAGFKNGETEAVLTKKPTLSTTATSESAPGTYEITISGAEATNYDITYGKGILIIKAAEAPEVVVVTAKSYTREYGEANPTFEYTSSGAALVGTPTLTCEATATSPVGTYPIKVSQGSVTNANVTYVDGVLTVTKAPLTIGCGTYEMTQGDPLPTFTAIYAGFKNGETEAVLTKKPTLGTTATSESAPGTYEITISGAEAENYAISYVVGTLVVKEKESSWQDGDMFTATTIEGVEMTFKIISTKDMTCQVGEGTYSGTRGVDTSTQGKITIPSSACGFSVVTIGESAFEGCSGLTSIDIPNSVTTISYSSFYSCSSLSSVNIPNSVTTIGNWAFSYCNSLISVTIPNSVTSIGNYAFSGCYLLTSITIPKNVRSIGYYFIDNCHSLHTIYSMIENPFNISDDDVFGNFCYRAVLYVPKGSESEYESAEGWKKFKCITSEEHEKDGTIFTTNTKEGVEMTFRIISEAEKICQVGDNAIWHTNGGGTGQRCVSYSTSGTVTIPAEVNGYNVFGIADLAFINCSSITSIVIPEGIVYIGKYALQGCADISKLDVPNSVEAVEEYAFSKCSSLTEVSLPNKIKILNEGVFWQDTSLTSIILPESIEEMDSYIFDECGSLTEIHSLMKEPCYLYSSNFVDEVYENATLYIPIGTMELYEDEDNGSWYRFNKIVEKENEPEPELAEGYYYLRNVETGLLLSCGGPWGTHILVDDYGLDLHLVKASDGEHWNLLTDYSSRTGDGSEGGVGTNLYVDYTTNIDLTIKRLTDGIYTVMGDNGMLLNVDTSDSLAYFSGNSTNDALAQWEFITIDDMWAQRWSDLEGATADSPVDATFLIKAAGMSHSSDRRLWRHWTLSTNTVYCKYGLGDRNSRPLVEVFRSAANSCYYGFAFEQTVTFRPGKYKLEVQGFYRDGDYSDAAPKHANGTEKLDAYLYVGNDDKTNRTALRSIFSDTKSSPQTGWSTYTSQGYIPDTFTEAGYTFLAGAYNNELTFTINGTDEVSAPLGVMADVSYNYNNWTAFCNFRLTYYGKKGSAIEDVVSDADDASASNGMMYDLSGRPISHPVKGQMYIQNGKKVLMK